MGGAAIRSNETEPNQIEIPAQVPHFQQNNSRTGYAESLRGVNSFSRVIATGTSRQKRKHKQRKRRNQIKTSHKRIYPVENSKPTRDQTRKDQTGSTAIHDRARKKPRQKIGSTTRNHCKKSLQNKNHLGRGKNRKEKRKRKIGKTPVAPRRFPALPGTGIEKSP